MSNAVSTAANAPVRPPLEYGLWIGNEARPGRGDKIDVIDPSTGAPIGTVANANTADGLDAVAAAQASGPKWAATPPRERAEVLRSCYELMVAERDMLSDLIALENGKSLSDAAGEVTYAAEFFRWFAEETVRLSGELALSPNGANRIIVSHKPIGVALLVTPWNFPAAMAKRKLAPALAAGCTCVLKPATETPLTAYALADLYARAGVPSGVVNVITTGRSGDVVAALLHDQRVRKLSFTGSTQVGRMLLREAADCIVSCSMELGGNAPFIVFDDADIDAAIEGAMIAKMRNGGEACTAANRFYVHRSVCDTFAAKLTRRMAGLKIGPGRDPLGDFGPMINSDAIEHLQALVEDALARGAQLQTGGQRLQSPGFFYPPTVLSDVQTQARVFQEEIFGPVAAIASFDDETDVIEQANSTEYGLVAYVYTRDLQRGLRVSQKLESGMVGLNRGLVSDPAAPFGGVKQSGLGREGGSFGIHEFCELQYIATQW